MIWPDLGKYALPVLLAYGISIGAIALLVAVSLWRAARVRAALREVEQARNEEGSPYA